MPVTRSDFVHACNVHLHAIVEKDLPLTIFGRVSGQLGFVWAVPDAVHFSICWICDFLQVSGVWWPLLCLSLYDSHYNNSVFTASMVWSANCNP